MTGPWYSMWNTNRRAQSWIDRVNSVIEAQSSRTPRAAVTVSAASTLVELPQLERAVTLAALALSERTPLVMLDQLDAFASAEDEAAFLAAVSLLAPESTTLVIGTPVPARALDVNDVTGARPVVIVDLYSTPALKGSLR